MFRTILFAAVLTTVVTQAAQVKAADVSIDNFTFTPSTLTIKPGETVTFVNHDDIPHSVVGKGGAFRSKTLDTDDKFSFTFTTAGEFAFFCGLHPHMTGKIIVAP